MAIARDNSGTATSNATTGLTTAFAVAGSDRQMRWGTSDLGGTTDRVTSVAYNGTNMTRINSIINSGHGSQYWYGLIAPSTGTNNVVSTYTASILTREIFASYTGAHQSTLSDSNATNSVTAASSPLNTTVTVGASNCWLVGYGQTNVLPFSAGTGTSVVNTLDGGYSGLVDSNGTVGTGSQSLQITWTGADTVELLIDAMPPVASSAPYHHLLTLGVG
jgi:hypothetical protein